MATYAAYYNLHQGMKAQSIINSRRASEASSSSGNKTSKKSALRSFVNGLRPTDVAQTPAGIYRPIINQGPLFSGLNEVEESQPIYQRERPLFGSFSKKNSKKVSATSTSSNE